MKTIPLDDLPRHSPWPARLLGLAPWFPPVRDAAKNAAEYDQGKFDLLLKWHKEHGGDPAAVRAFETRGGAEVAVSVGDALAVLPRAEAFARHDALIADSLAPSLAGAASVVELGCGWGYNLWDLARRFAGPAYSGAESSANAIKLAARFGVEVRPSDLLADDFRWLAKLPRPLVVFTVYAVAVLPTFGPALRRLAAAGPLDCFHFEPVLGLCDDSLLGLLRRKYAEANDYNRDLWDALKSTPGVEIVQARASVYGVNPLSPTSVVRWRVT